MSKRLMHKPISWTTWNLHLQQCSHKTVTIEQLMSHLVGVFLVYFISDCFLLWFSEICRFNLYGVLEYCKNEHVQCHTSWKVLSPRNFSDVQARKKSRKFRFSIEQRWRFENLSVIFIIMKQEEKM